MLVLILEILAFLFSTQIISIDILAPTGFTDVTCLIPEHLFNDVLTYVMLHITESLTICVEIWLGDLTVGVLQFSP